MYLGILDRIVAYFWPSSTGSEDSTARIIPVTGMTCVICTHSMHHQASKIVFIIGAPGTGKGTQSDFIVNRYGLQHLSYGDLMRGLRERGDPVVSRLETKPGTNNPSVSDGLGVWYIWQELRGGAKGGKKSSWLIDGFPRREEQVIEWLKMIPRANMTLGAKAGADARPEDLDPEFAMRRIQQFYENADWVVGKLRERGMTVVEVDTNRSEWEIQADLEKIMDPVMEK
ncbi:ump-cmp kinase [Colletotrichum musicola]|uniref:Ump-cmp kinase n=1 Tax=Colletotrichum musicola TaxID=2175873 RepID=A0A8H6NDH3_9PEZI|nr:ump-cmp kinase [Colletotrichum musicola]